MDYVPLATMLASGQLTEADQISRHYLWTNSTENNSTIKVGLTTTDCEVKRVNVCMVWHMKDRIHMIYKEGTGRISSVE